MDSIRLPRKLKKAIKATFFKEVMINKIKNPKKVVSFLYKETLNYESGEMLDNLGIQREASVEAKKLGLGVKAECSLELKTINSDFNFSIN